MGADQACGAQTRVLVLNPPSQAWPCVFACLFVCLLCIRLYVYLLRLLLDLYEEWVQIKPAGLKPEFLCSTPLAKPGRALHQAFGQEQLPAAILLEMQS